MVLNTVPKSNELYHNRSVQMLVKMAKATTMTAAMTRVGKIAPRGRRVMRRLLTWGCSSIQVRQSGCGRWEWIHSGRTGHSHERTRWPSGFGSVQRMCQHLSQAWYEVGSAEQLVRFAAQPGHPVPPPGPVDADDDPHLLASRMTGNHLGG